MSGIALSGSVKAQALRTIFTDLTAWVGQCGYTLAPWQAEAAALTPVPPTASHLGRRATIPFLTLQVSHHVLLTSGTPAIRSTMLLPQQIREQIYLSIDLSVRTTRRCQI